VPAFRSNSPPVQARAGVRRLGVSGVVLLLTAAWSAAALAQPCPPVDLAGDGIGSDSALTNRTGGFTAVLEQGTNLGQPAILAPLSGSESLTEFRAIVFGLPTAKGVLRFDRFDFRLELWPAADYFSGAPATYRVALGRPSNQELVTVSPDYVVPATPFGNAGLGGDNAATYDLRFDLTGTAPGGKPLLPFGGVLPAGEWVVGFQSQHVLAESGSLRVSGSGAPEGPLPLFSREGSVPRGILGNQNRDQIILRWGLSLRAEMLTPSGLPGDFNGDLVVDAADYTTWRDERAAATGAAGYLCWRTNFTRLPADGPAANQLAGFEATHNFDNSLANVIPQSEFPLRVPEPPASWLLLAMLAVVIPAVAIGRWGLVKGSS
jgi:hypothetical protein